MHYFSPSFTKKNYRSLVVLDHVEAVLPCSLCSLQAECDRAIPDTHGTSVNYEEYEELFKHLGQGRHQSCVVLTSREAPKRVQQLAGTQLSIRVFPVSGLQPAQAQQIFRGLQLNNIPINRGE